MMIASEEKPSNAASEIRQIVSRVCFCVNFKNASGYTTDHVSVYIQELKREKSIVHADDGMGSCRSVDEEFHRHFRHMERPQSTHVPSDNYVDGCRDN